MAVSSHVFINAEMNAWNPDNLPADWNVSSDFKPHSY